MNTNKYLEYYLDSKIYSNDEVEKSIEETKKEFPNKNIKVNISLNEFGVYVITFEFEKRDTFFNKIKILFMGKKKSSKVMIKNEDSNKTITEISQKTRKSKEQRKQEKIQKRFERYSGNNVYGKYKNTGIYRPY